MVGTISTNNLLFAFLGTLLLVAFAACGSSDESTEAFQRIHEGNGALTIAEFESVGIKTTRQYNVSDLPAAKEAWFGFRRVSGTEPVEFELRFYSDHDAAVANGIEYAEDATGEDANLLSTNAAWVDGIQDRSIRVPQGAGDIILPKYLDYAVYGNTVMLCQGRTTLSAQSACEWLIGQLGSVVATGGDQSPPPAAADSTTTLESVAQIIDDPIVPAVEPEAGSREAMVLAVFEGQTSAINHQDWDAWITFCDPTLPFPPTVDEITFLYNEYGVRFDPLPIEPELAGYNMKNVSVKFYGEDTASTAADIYNYDELIRAGASDLWIKVDGAWYSDGVYCKSPGGKNTR